jgi:uncharacterized protein YheU (UPF0270 family)
MYAARDKAKRLEPDEGWNVLSTVIRYGANEKSMESRMEEAKEIMQQGKARERWEHTHGKQPQPQQRPPQKEASVGKSAPQQGRSGPGKSMDAVKSEGDKSEKIPIVNFRPDVVTENAEKIKEDARKDRGYSKEASKKTQQLYEERKQQEVGKIIGEKAEALRERINDFYKAEMSRDLMKEQRNLFNKKKLDPQIAELEKHIKEEDRRWKEETALIEKAKEGNPTQGLLQQAGQRVGQQDPELVRVRDELNKIERGHQKQERDEQREQRRAERQQGRHGRARDNDEGMELG